MLKWLCGVPSHEFDGKRQKIAYIAFTTCVIFTTITAVMAGALFIYKNVSFNLEETLYALSHTISALKITYQSIVAVFLCHKLLAIFGVLSTIYDKSNTEFKLVLKMLCFWSLHLSFLWYYHNCNYLVSQFNQNFCQKPIRMDCACFFFDWLVDILEIIEMYLLCDFFSIIPTVPWWYGLNN